MESQRSSQAAVGSQDPLLLAPAAPPASPPAGEASRWAPLQPPLVRPVREAGMEGED